MFINQQRRELSLKIVYYGPALSGKTTNLQYIHAKSNPNIRGDLVSLKTRGDRTLFFDFLQLELGNIAGLKPRFNLYTVPGQVYYSRTRKLVLQGADGVVFVADSQAQRLQANVEAVRDLGENLRALGVDPQRIPLVLQCNKQDLRPILTPAILQRSLRLPAVPCFASVAVGGQGVFDTLKAAINLVVADVKRAF
jgi:hypothetical protein